MHFMIDTTDLKNLLSKLQSAVASKVPVPILSNIHLQATNDKLIATVTDLNLGIQCIAPANIRTEGTTTIPVRQFYSLAKELTAPILEIATTENDITHLKANSSQFTLNGLSSRDYPSLPDLTGSIRLSLEQSELRKMFASTSFAISKEDNRYVLTGLCMTIEGDKASFIATDGKRLARAHTRISAPIEGEYKAIIPTKAIDEVLKNLKESGNVELYLLDDKIAFVMNQTTIITKLLMGEYPDVNRVIPTQTLFNIEIHRDEIISLLRQVSLFTSANKESARFTFSNGTLTLQAISSELGAGEVSMDINYQGEPLEIAFNPIFFLDLLRHCHKETFVIGLIDAFSPALISEETPTPTSSPLFILMPMRLNDE